MSVAQSVIARLVSGRVLQPSDVSEKKRELQFRIHFEECAERRNTAGLQWSGIVAVSGAVRMNVAGKAKSDVQSVVLELAGVMGRFNEWSVRAEPSTTTWKTLNCLAHLTYVPASERLRLMGAGTGISNHD